jgi:hypothetical protein
MKRQAGLLFLVLILCCGTVFADDETVRVEAETLFAFEDMDNPAFDRNYTDSHASGGKTVRGFDRPGQWIEIYFEALEPMTFIFSVRSAGLIGLIRTYYVDFMDTNSRATLVSDTLITPEGQGAG